jgi:hypothetical protein
MFGVVNELPVNNELPPDDELYHFIGFAAVAVSVTVPEPHRLPGVVVGAGGRGLTVATASTRLL